MGESRGRGPKDDEASVDELREAIKRTHALDATWLESSSVHEKVRDKTVWKGHVQVFAVTGHATATRCYAWSHRTDGGGRKFYALLGLGPVKDARSAVQAAIVAEYKKTLS